MRKIIVDNKEFQYKIGKKFTKICFENSVKIVSNEILFNFDFDYKTPEGREYWFVRAVEDNRVQITPKDVERWIKENS